MNGNRIDIMEFGLREGNGWLRAGWPYLVAAYREHMRRPR